MIIIFKEYIKVIKSNRKQHNRTFLLNPNIGDCVKWGEQLGGCSQTSAEKLEDGYKTGPVTLDIVNYSRKKQVCETEGNNNIAWHDIVCKYANPLGVLAHSLPLLQIHKCYEIYCAMLAVILKWSVGN